MSKAPPGSARGDQSIYAGRQLLGVIRSSTAGVVVFDGTGRVLGTFHDRRAARDALHGRDAAQEGVAS